MIELGKTQELVLVKQMSFGAYLAENIEAPKEEQILLPAKQVPEDVQDGDTLSVFVYKDSEDRMIATMREPFIELGEIAFLKVADTTKVGAFLEWGLEKDLLLPFAQQTRPVEKGENVLAALYVDKSGRLAATMNVYEYLRTDSPYSRGDEVSGTVYETSDNFGIFVAVDDTYSGLLPKAQIGRDYEIGQTYSFYVSRLKEDGKLDLSERLEAYLQMDADSEHVLEIIREQYKGKLPFDDKADPELIKKTFGLSKNAFKRAVGRLYKNRVIKISDGSITVLR